ncbi:hypothetical protein ASPZODRAFT_18032 [Penicilliopsis zonata CBS 506.65]|uniref:Major facilitator superfamily (MFS) profile domain-containing protein n=1 Tax=Penicilliopsis zonata CBS 506.65 TaxID=1073090 RepID=A0A1L9SDB0_9EURO|nr:hypothetical protein ASPZODRAFT_18032 [Penicilliopsis zonata CBS 506.65]OJJ45122.1 hypothetical protein ASPZODRAFT_18032 [Penicilliopsis zonata CBS 506.65]
MEKAEITHEEFHEDPSRLVELSAAQEATLQESKSIRQTFREDRKVFAVLAAALASALILGTDTTAVNSLVGSQSFCYVMGEGYMSNGKYAVRPETVSIWSAVAAPAQVMGQFLMGPIADIFGRRAVIFFNVAVMIVGVVIEFIAPNWKVFALAKFILAFVSGLTQATAPMYISELAPRNARGLMIALYLFIGNFGDMLSVILCYVGQQTWPDASDKWAYRMPLCVCLCLPVVVLTAQLFLLCESPSWLIIHGKNEQARKTLKFMYPRRSEDEIELIYAEYEYTLGQEAEQRAMMKQSSFAELFKGKDLRRTFCAFFPPITASLAGNVLTGPQKTYFFTLSGQSNSLASTCIAIAIGIVSISFVFALSEVKHVGRRRLLLTGQTGLLFSMIGIGVTALVMGEPYGTQAGKIMLGFLCIGVFSATLGPNGCGWIYIGESGSLRLRAKTATIGTMGNGVVGVVYNVAIPYMLETNRLGVGGSALYFAAFGVIDVLVTYFFIPDFTGRSYAQIDELFHRQVPARKFRSTVCTGNYGQDILHRKIDN